MPGLGKTKMSDFFCENIFESAYKLELDIYPTAFLATSIYHRTCESMNLPKDADTRCVVAATSLLLASKSYGDSAVSIDDVLVIFYPFFFHEELNLIDPGPHYEIMKKLMDQISWLIFKKLNANIACKLPSDYLLEYLWAIQQILTSETKDRFDIPKATWAIVSDFYLCKQSVIFKPQYIAIAAIYCVLRSLHIRVPGCASPKSLDWATTCVEDATIENIRPVLDVMLSQQVSEEFEAHYGGSISNNGVPLVTKVVAAAPLLPAV